MTPKSFRGLERDLDAMISAANSVATSSDMRDAAGASQRVRKYRGEIVKRIERLTKAAYRSGVRAARKVTT